MLNIFILTNELNLFSSLVLNEMKTFKRERAPADLKTFLPYKRMMMVVGSGAD